MKRTMVVLIAAFALFGASIFVAAESASKGDDVSFARHRVHVFFTRSASISDDCSRTMSFDRRTAGEDVLHDALAWLMKGPRPAEHRAGATSFFSHKTSGRLNSVSIEDGTAFVDFDDLRHVIPSASTSCGSASLFAELTRTVKQFPTVDRAVYSLEGNVTAFYEWLQMSAPR